MSTSKSAPNIVLIVADYMGYRDIEPFGAEDIRTPALSQLARDGTRFTNFYAAAPVCAPARAALLSGQYPERVGVARNPVGSEGLAVGHDTVALKLARAGYDTALFGKWHLGAQANSNPRAQGFNQFLGFYPWTISYHSHQTVTGEPGLCDHDGPVTREGYLTDLLSDEACAFVSAQRAQPYFLYLAYNSGLPPYQRPEMPKSDWGRGWDVNEATREDYRAMVECMDTGIGRVLDAVDRDGQRDDTLVIFLYDHGGRHLVDSRPFFHGFGTLWEGGIRVPLIVRWPDATHADTVIDTPAIAMDVSATMLAASQRHITAGEHHGNAAATTDGIDLAPHLTCNTYGGERTFFWRTDYPNFLPQRAVRKGDFKFVQDGQTQFLFNLRTDPGERENLLGTRPDLVNELRAAHTAWAATMPD